MNKRIFILRLILIGLFLVPNFSYSQTDTLQIKRPDTVAKTQSEKPMLKSPLGAVLRSLVLPGWGQYYVESYWKTPIFIAGWGTVIFFIYDNHTKYLKAADEFTNYIGTDATEKDYLFRKREYFRDYRDLNILYLAGIYLISCVDAYVGANLYEFNVDDNLSINYRLNTFGTMEMGVKVKF